MATTGPGSMAAQVAARRALGKTTAPVLMRRPYSPRVGRPLAADAPTLPDTPAGRLAGRVRQYRVERGWSQAELAKRMKGHAWHQTTVAKTERAERDPRYPELLGLAEALAVPLNALLDAAPGAGADGSSELRLAIHRLEQEEQLLTFRVAALDRDIDDMEIQRKEHLQRLSELQKEIAAARKAYKAAGT